MKDERLDGDIIQHLNIIGCEMKGLQWNVYKKYYVEEENNFALDVKGLQLCNIVFGEDLDIDLEEISSENHIGKSGFNSALEVKEINGDLRSEN